MTESTVVHAPPVTVVVCSFDEQRWGDLEAALDGVRAQTLTPAQVVLVVDHNEALLDRARRAWDPGIDVRPNTGTRGLSGARNTGVAAATGAVVAFLDDDATPEVDWLAHLVAPFADRRVVAVGGRAVPRWHHARPAWWPAEFDWVVGCTYRGMPDGGPVRNVLGATMAFRSAVFDDGERFSSSVGRTGASAAGCEETELCIRVSQRRPDAVILFEPRAVVHHHVSPARERFSYFARRTYAEGRSKATVARLVGSRDALSTERSYVTRTLPAGVVEGLLATSRRRDLAGAARAGAIGTGLFLTTAGYGIERVAAPLAKRPGGHFAPVGLLQLELTEPTLSLSAPGYLRARLLVRHDGRPVGAVDVALDRDGRVSDATAALVRARFAPEPVVEHHAPRPAPPLAAAVVIATHDRPEHLRRCLDSVLATEDLGPQVVVVDNAPSSEATQDLVQRDYPTVTYVREEVPGLSRAHNRGLEHVTAPVVAFTDDDVVVDPAWLRHLVAPFSSDRVGCVTGLIWPAELETPAQVLIEEHGGFAKGFVTRTFDLRDHRPDDPLFPYTAGSVGSGANMAFRTDVLRELGGFDPALGAGSRGRGGDDLAAFLDVLEAGHTVVYEPGAVVHHLHRREARDVRSQAHGYGIGLSAYLTRVVVRRPTVLATFVRLAPRGAAHLAARSTGHGSGSGSRRPRWLLLWQLAGIARGPVAYARSVREVRRAPAGAM